MNNQTITQELKEVILEALKHRECNNLEDLLRLHNELFNEDYYIIGHWEARQWLKKHDVDAFEAIAYVRDNEMAEFGEMSIDITPESVVNAFVYWYSMDLVHDLPLENHD